ncbi:MAG: ATP-binding protein [Anaerolineae bacterium]|nr:ATP-binding protein [Anaerolineae bacterium]
MPTSRRRRGLTCDMVSLPSARLDHISELLDFVDAFCEQAGIGERDQFDLRLAIEEVCANVMMHGYSERAPGPLEISFCADDETISVTISDRAEPFDPEHAPPPDLDSPPELRPIGGLGWHLVRQVMDDVRYRYDATYGNTVVLTKRLAAPEDATDAPPARD